MRLERCKHINTAVGSLIIINAYSIDHSADCLLKAIITCFEELLFDDAINPFCYGIFSWIGILCHTDSYAFQLLYIFGTAILTSPVRMMDQFAFRRQLL